MENLFKRIVSLFICIVTCFVLTVPAFADTGSDIGENVGTFAEWLYRISYPGETIKKWWENKFSSSGDSAAYTDYVTTVKDVLGTSTVGDNCVYLGNWSEDITYNTDRGSNLSYTFVSGSTFTVSGTMSKKSGDQTGFRCLSTFIAPVSGTYSFTVFLSDSLPVVFNETGTFSLYEGTKRLAYRSFNSGVISGDGSFSYGLTAGSTYYIEFWMLATSGQSGSFTTSGACRMEYPSGGFEAAAGSTNVSPETRTGSLCGDYFYSGDNGSMTQAENIYLFDETNNIINNPATGTTATASSWTYDYETRTYTITATDGSTYTIVHGDESAEVKHMDSSNTTNIYNYYYGTSGGSGEDPGEEPDKESIWDKLGKLLGSITDGFLEVVKAFLGKLLDSLTSLVDMINSKIGHIVESILALFDYFPSLFSGFTGFLAAVFPFLPQEFFDILILGAALASVLLILKVLRK